MIDLQDIAEIGDDDQAFEVSEALLKAKADHEAMLAIFENRKKLRTIAVPTDDAKVKLKLREFLQPITLFGEGPAERRDRLRLLLLNEMQKNELLSKKEEIQPSSLDHEEKHTLDLDHENETSDKKMEVDEDKETMEDEAYWTPGSEALLEARLFMLNYSIRRAQQRIAIHRADFATSHHVFKRLRHDLDTDLQTYTHFCSQLVDERPTSFVSFAPNSQLLATGSFSGNLHLYRVPQATLFASTKGHTDRVGGIAWHPQATLGSLSKHVGQLVSGSSDGSVAVWSLDLNQLARLEGHTARVSRVAYHPSGRFVGSASFDTTWKLWDVASQSCLLTQDGHAAEVYCIAFHLDGSLVGTGGLDGYGNLWDVRVGQCVWHLQGHLKQVLAFDFAPSGYHVVTGSQDNTVKVWDLRMCKCIYTVPAHTSLVSQVKYYVHQPSCCVETDLDGVQGYLDVHQGTSVSDLKYERGHPITSGMYFASCGFDGKINVWGDGDFKLIHSFLGHEGKVMSMDISSDSQFIASAGYDRTFKLWASHQVQI